MQRELHVQCPALFDMTNIQLLNTVLGYSNTIPDCPTTRTHLLDKRHISQPGAPSDHEVDDTKIGAIYRTIVNSKMPINVREIAAIAGISVGVVTNSITRLYRGGKLNRERQLRNGVTCFYYWGKRNE